MIFQKSLHRLEFQLVNRQPLNKRLSVDEVEMDNLRHHTLVEYKNIQSDYLPKGSIAFFNHHPESIHRPRKILSLYIICSRLGIH